MLLPFWEEPNFQFRSGAYSWSFFTLMDSKGVMLNTDSASRVARFTKSFARRSYGLCAISLATLGASSAFAQVTRALALVGTPPNGQVNVPYFFNGISSPLFRATYSLLSGTLPPGLELKTNTTLCGPITSIPNSCTSVELSGTPTNAGTYNFSVIGSEGRQGDTAIGSFVITIAPAAIPPAQLATNVPTLSPWALIGLALTCVVLARRRLKR